MRFSQVAAVLSVTAVASAQLTFNVTQAYKKGNWNKYHCLDSTKLKSWLPECLHECQDSANKADGCAPDDFACHCINYTVFSDLIEPCAFPVSMGGKGTCTMDELTIARPIVQDMCNFFNATIYADYRKCDQELSKKKTFGIVHQQKTIAIDAEHESDVHTEDKHHVYTEDNHHVHTEEESDADTEDGSDVDTEGESDVETEGESDVDTEGDCDFDTGDKHDAYTEDKHNVHAEDKHDHEADTLNIETY